MSREDRRQNRIRRRTRLGIESFIADTTHKIKPEEMVVFKTLLENDRILDEALDHLESNATDTETVSVMSTLSAERPPRDWKGFFRRIGQAFLRIMPYLIELISILIPSLAPLLGAIQKPIEWIISNLPDPGAPPAPVTA